MRRPTPNPLVAATAAVVLAATVVGCGNDSTGRETKTIDVESMQDPPKGTITWCAQKDSSGAFGAVVDAFNERYASAGYELELLEFPANTDEQRNQFVQRQNAKSPECDVFGADVTWTAEFADKGFVYDLTPYVKKRADEYVPSTLETTKYKGKHWAVPFGTNVGFLYYRTDQVETAPTTWQEAHAAGKANNGYVYQASSYEGLTVNFLEVAAAAGGKVLSGDGKSSAINSPANVEALRLMVDGMKNGATPKASLTYTEEESRRAWEAGKASLMRNWTYAYVLGKQNKKVADKFDITTLPKWQGGSSSGVLGGVNIVISKYSKNVGAALKAADFITSERAQAAAAVTGGQPPTLRATYDDPQVQRALPFHDELEKGVEQANSRPVTPVYSQVSRAIYKNVSAALGEKVTPEQALEQADEDINEALQTF